MDEYGYTQSTGIPVSPEGRTKNTLLILQTAIRLRPAFTSAFTRVYEWNRECRTCWRSLLLPVAVIWQQQTAKTRP